MHEQAAWLIELDGLLEAGDVEGYFEAYDDAIVVHIHGRSAIAGTFRGKPAVRGMFDRFIERGGDMRYERVAAIADDTYGVLRWRASGRRGEAAFEGTETMFVRFDGRRIMEAWIAFEERDAFDAYIGS